ncbi:SCO family protein [Aeromonas enteropelogenes]|uniref:Photosynthetic protein synthase I n=1 Tax=Aeromonas enteropelogenes TaxID=29489 RepID=A0A175VEZ6_AEREN|nr:SCO family protein [Aeromonas enteropelogenes]KXU79079.1 photosynthetic protein synthase I [Aeromonas enteropelogenes]
MMKLRYPLIFLLLTSCLIFAFYVTRPEMPEHADYYPAARDINDFTFTDADNQPFTPANLLGHWTFLFVGYTFCPDICPTTMADLRSIYGELKQLAPNSQVVFVSADPQRDTLERLKTYTAFFNPEFKAVTADHDKLFPFVRNLGLIYSIANQGEKDYLIDHSASIVLINPKGKLQGVFRPQVAPGQVPLVQMATLLSDFSRILKLSGNRE